MTTSGSVLRVGHLSTVYHTAFLLKGTDLLQKRGIQATWTLYPSGPDIINAMQNGTIDLAYIGLPPVIIGIDKGLSLACIAGGHVEGTVLVAGGATRPLADFDSIKVFLSQFSGSAIGTPPKGSIHDVIINDLLNKRGIRDVTVKNYPWADFLPDALTEGEIAAAAGTPALAVTARRYGDAKLVIPPDHLWPFNPSYGIVVMRDMLANGELLSRFLSAHESATEMIRNDPSGCAAIIEQTTGMVDAQFVLEAYRISPKYCASLPSEYVNSTMKFARTLHVLGYTRRVIQEKELFDRSLIEKVHPFPEHYSKGIAH